MQPLVQSCPGSHYAQEDLLVETCLQVQPVGLAKDVATSTFQSPNSGSLIQRSHLGKWERNTAPWCRTAFYSTNCSPFAELTFNL